MTATADTAPHPLAEEHPRCALCDQPVEPHQLPAELDDDGLPWASAISMGYGLQLMPMHCFPLEVRLNGNRLEGCTAFDRRAGTAWRYATTIIGDPVIDIDGNRSVEQVTGHITVHRMERSQHQQERTAL